MAFRAVYFDLDGTLLDARRQVSARTQAVLDELRARTVHLGVATGRTLRSAMPHIEASGARAPAVLCNGARIQNVDGAVRYEQNLPAAAGLALVTLCRQHDVFINCYHGDDISIEDRCPRSEASAAKDGVRQNRVPDLHALIASRAPTKIMMIHAPPAMDAFESLARIAVADLDADLVRSEPEYLEALARGITKGTGLARAAALLEVELTDVIAFGDSTNDIEMLRAAGLGVAVGNAPAEVQAAADRICGHHDEDGVARCLEEIFAL